MTAPATVRAPEATSASPPAEVASARAIVLDQVSKVYGHAGDVTHDLQLENKPVLIAPVNEHKVLADGKTGYLHYTDFATPSGEQGLIEAVQGFRQAGVTDLVVDLRYNGGGILGIASQLAYMVSSKATTQNKTFEQLTFNRKDPFPELNPDKFLRPQGMNVTLVISDTATTNRASCCGCSGCRSRPRKTRRARPARRNARRTQSFY